MPAVRVAALTALAMLAFAGNSLLCRAALRETPIDAATFTSIRIASGALALWVIVRRRDGRVAIAGSWPSAAALFAYAAFFSYAYLGLTAATGALLLFGAVQATMMGEGLARGERIGGLRAVGAAVAFSGLAGLLFPGLSAPSPFHACLMLAAGVAWGMYSVRGRGVGDPTQVTAGNFARAVVLAAILSAIAVPWTRFDAHGAVLAVASGAITSGVGYAIWYAALKGLDGTGAATVQLSVPAITALGGVTLLGETLTLRIVLASAAILGGIALVIRARNR